MRQLTICPHVLFFRQPPSLNQRKKQRKKSLSPCALGREKRVDRIYRINRILRKRAAALFPKIFVTIHHLCESTGPFYSALVSSSHTCDFQPHAVKRLEPPAPFGRSTRGTSPRRTVAAGITQASYACRRHCRGASRGWALCPATVCRAQITSLWVPHVE
jgi:hypothetical protein